MKHSLKITLAIILLFLASQLIGLLVINKYVDAQKTAETGETVYKDLPYDFERPDVSPTGSVLLILGLVFIGTLLILVLIRFRGKTLWRVWFFLSVLLALSIALSAFIPSRIALGISIILATLKIFRPSVVIHNLSELFIYGGIAAIFVPILNLPAVLAMLVGISLYDAYAVWKSKHMVKLAKFQVSSRVFSGLFIPYQLAKKELKKQKGLAKFRLKKEKTKNAILGGGDIGFPLIFAGVVMKSAGFYNALIIPVFAAIALLFLMVKAEENKFYPAMPFISVGCVVGYLVTLLI